VGGKSFFVPTLDDGAPFEEAVPDLKESFGPSKFGKRQGHIADVIATAGEQANKLETSAEVLTMPAMSVKAAASFLEVLQTAKGSEAFTGPADKRNNAGNGTGLNAALGVLFRTPVQQLLSAKDITVATAGQLPENVGRFQDSYKFQTGKALSDVEYNLVSAFQNGLKTLLKNGSTDAIADKVLFRVGFPGQGASYDLTLLPFMLGAKANAPRTPMDFLNMGGRVFIRSSGYDRNGRLQSKETDRALNGFSLLTTIEKNIAAGGASGQVRINRPTGEQREAQDIIAYILEKGGMVAPTIGQVRVLVRLARYNILDAAGELLINCADLNECVPTVSAAEHYTSIFRDICMNAAAHSGEKLPMNDWLDRVEVDVRRISAGQSYITIKKDSASRYGYKVEAGVSVRPRTMFSTPEGTQASLNVVNGRGTSSRTSTTGTFVVKDLMHATKKNGANKMYKGVPDQRGQARMVMDSNTEDFEAAVQKMVLSSGMSESSVRAVLRGAGVDSLLHRMAELAAVSMQPGTLSVAGQGMLRPNAAQLRYYRTHKPQTMGELYSYMASLGQKVQKSALEPKAKERVMKDLEFHLQAYQALQSAGQAAVGAGGQADGQ